MPCTEQTLRLMHAVLDGEAAPAEAEALQRLLAADPEARDEFERLQRLFGALAELPARHPPEGLVAAVTAALPAIPQKGRSPGQLSGSPGVLGPSSDAIHVRGDGPMTRQQEQSHPSRRSFPMNQPHPPYSAKRKALIGAGIAAVAVLVVFQFGFDSTPRSEDVAGTVQPAQRYRAAQTGAADIKLGDQTVAQLMQNDAFVKLVRDPNIQAMARDPGFAAAIKVMQDNPQLALLVAQNPESVNRLASQEAAQAIFASAQANQQMMLAAEAASRVQADAAAMQFLAGAPELQKYVHYLAEMHATQALGKALNQTDMQRLLAEQAALAERMAVRVTAAERIARSQAVERFAAQNLALQQFMQQNESASRLLEKQAEAMQKLARNAEAMQLVAMNTSMMKVFMMDARAAEMLQNPAALQVLASNPQAAQAMLAAPEVSRYIMLNAEASRNVIQAVAAERRI